jgi:predicted transcriptional regulator
MSVLSFLRLAPNQRTTARRVAMAIARDEQPAPADIEAIFENGMTAKPFAEFAKETRKRFDKAAELAELDKQLPVIKQLEAEHHKTVADCQRKIEEAQRMIDEAIAAQADSGARLSRARGSQQRRGAIMDFLNATADKSIDEKLAELGSELAGLESESQLSTAERIARGDAEQAIATLTREIAPLKEQGKSAVGEQAALLAAKEMVRQLDAKVDKSGKNQKRIAKLQQQIEELAQTKLDPCNIDIR